MSSRSCPIPLNGSPAAGLAYWPCLTLIMRRVIIRDMIRSFRCKETERIFRREGSRKFPPGIQRGAQRKLVVLDSAEALDDLRTPPGNRLEKLSGDRQGQYSIRINERWRICFRWSAGNAGDVEIVDYH